MQDVNAYSSREGWSKYEARTMEWVSESAVASTLKIKSFPVNDHLHSYLTAYKKIPQ